MQLGNATFAMSFRHPCGGVIWGVECVNLKFRGEVQRGGSSGLERWVCEC